MPSKLAPPPGHESWLEWAINDGDYRTLGHDQIWDDKYRVLWGRELTREDMRNCVDTEFQEAKEALRLMKGTLFNRP